MHRCCGARWCPQRGVEPCPNRSRALEQNAHLRHEVMSVAGILVVAFSAEPCHAASVCRSKRIVQGGPGFDV